jgi:hypothetical protein
MAKRTPQKSTDRAYKGYLIRRTLLGEIFVEKGGAFIGWAKTESAAEKIIDMLTATINPRRKKAGRILRTAHVRKSRKHNPGVRIVHNRLLGGWFVVRGTHQTPLNGSFASKAAAQAWLDSRKRNPARKRALDRVPRKLLGQAGRLFEDFTGDKSANVQRIKKPEIPEVLVAIGTIDGILYSTVRDGEVERYIHKFVAKARPTFAVSPDGKQLFMLGGAYNFTERGIVDKTTKR